MVGPERPQFILFGSSIVQWAFSRQGWAAILADIYARKADVVMRGYAGWNSRRALQVLDKVFPKDADVQPSLVIVYFGGNDLKKPHPSGLGPHVPLAEYVENMKKMDFLSAYLSPPPSAGFEYVSLSDTTRLIFLSTPPVNEAQICKEKGETLDSLSRTNECCRIYSEACIELCQELDVKVVDMWTALQRRKDWLDVCFTDGIHLTSEASEIVAKEILKVIKEAEWKPRLHWRSLPTEFSEDSPFDNVGSQGQTVNVSELNQNWQMDWIWD